LMLFSISLLGITSVRFRTSPSIMPPFQMLVENGVSHDSDRKSTPIPASFCMLAANTSSSISGAVMLSLHAMQRTIGILGGMGPLINRIEETCCALPESARRIALLATRPTLDSCLYQDTIYSRCADRRDLLMLDTAAWQAEVDDLIRTVKTARKRHQAEVKWN